MTSAYLNTLQVPVPHLTLTSGVLRPKMKNTRSFFRVVIAMSILAVFSSGCGESRNSAPVGGKVTLNGAPVSDAIVRFQPVGSGDVDKPEAGMGSYGRTDSEGNFELVFSDNGKSGAIIGDHTVIIDDLTPEEDANNDAGGLNQPSKSRIPTKWANGSTRFTVKDGPNEANFDLGS